jgi:hypothetical protein
MTTKFLPIDRDKSPLTAVDEEAVRLADVLKDHPDASDVTGRLGLWRLDPGQHTMLRTAALPAPAHH